MTGSDISGVTQENNEQSASQEEPRITLDISGISHPETSPVDSIPKVSDSTNRMSTTALLASGNLPPNKPDGTDSLASLNSSSRGKSP